MRLLLVALFAILMVPAVASGGGFERRLAAVQETYTSGDYRAAKADVEKLIVRIESREGVESAALVDPLTILSGCFANLGDPIAGVLPARRAVAIQEAVDPDDKLLLEAIRNLGALLYQAGELIESTTVLDRAIALARERGDVPLVLSALLANQGLSAVARGDLKHGLNLTKAGLDLALENLEPGDPKLARAHGNYAYALTMRGFYDEAAEQQLAAYDIFLHAYGPEHALTIQARYNVGVAMHSHGDLEGARDIYLEVMPKLIALRGPDHADNAALMSSLAGIYNALGEPKVAESWLKRGLALLHRTVSLDHPYANSLGFTLVHSVALQGDLDKARMVADKWQAWERNSLDTIASGSSERERIAALQLRRASFGLWISLHEDALESYTAVLEWKGVAKRAVMDQRIAAREGNDPELVAEFEELERVRDQLAGVAFGDPTKEIEIQRLLSQKAQLERSLSTRSADFHREQEAISRDLPSICAAMPSDSVLVDYLHYHRLQANNGAVPQIDSVVAFVVTSDDCQVRRVEVGAMVDIEALASKWWTLLADPDALPARLDGAGERMREQVWDPLEIHDAKHVIIAPETWLAWIPFGALPKDGDYLIESYPITYVDSAQDLLRFDEPIVPSEGALVVGGVTYQAEEEAGPLLAMRSSCLTDDLANLPGSAEEAREIAGILRSAGMEVTEVGGPEARESRIRREILNRRYVHLATHGFHVREACANGGGMDLFAGLGMYDPMLETGILLSGVDATAADGADDGIWTAEEVSSLDLRGTQLVVLSACRTGLAATPQGEGVLGLRRGLAYAGVRTLVSSLWSVDDEATSALMQSFYRALATGESPSKALQSAQIEMLQKNRRELGEGWPQLWAAFIPAGDWR